MTQAEKDFADILAQVCKNSLKDIELHCMLGLMDLVAQMLIRAHNTAQGLQQAGDN